MERLTIELGGWRSPAITEQLELLKRALEELSSERPSVKARPERGSRIPVGELQHSSRSVYGFSEIRHRRC